MTFETSCITNAILVGVSATIILDAWSLFLKLAFKVAPPNFCMVGRWLLHMPQGKFVHASIAAAEPKTEAMICTYECTFCAACVETVIAKVCPNCGGGFAPCPIRPSRNWKGDNYLGNDPASTLVKHRPVDRAEHLRLERRCGTSYRKNGSVPAPQGPQCLCRSNGRLIDVRDTPTKNRLRPSSR